MKNKIKILIVFLVTIIFITQNTLAANIGISPASIYFENVLRGGYSEKIVTITIDTEEETRVEIVPRGEIMEWLEFPEETFSVSKNNPYNLRLSANPPEDTPNGNYTGFLRVKSSSTSREQQEGQATGIVLPVLDLFVQIEVTDIEYFKCQATNFRVSSVEEGDNLILKADILNLGNIKIKPELRADIWDSEQIEMVLSKGTSNTQIDPTTKKEVELIIDSSNFELGQYWVDLSAIDCGSSSTLTFDILEEGALKADGKLKDIIINVPVELKETTLIKSLFENTGEKDVKALFQGKISLEGKTVQLLESEKQIIEVGEIGEFDFYFTPKQPGIYIVSGRVSYDGKRTYEKSVKMIVKPKGITFRDITRYILYLVLIFGIAFLLYKIRQEKTKYQNKLRSFKR